MRKTLKNQEERDLLGVREFVNAKRIGGNPERIVYNNGMNLMRRMAMTRMWC